MDVQYTKNKGFCEDITEGKFSFPIIHSIFSGLDDGRLIGKFSNLRRSLTIYILGRHTTSEHLKLCFIQYLRESQSISYTREVLRALDAAAREQIGRLGGNRELVILLDTLRIDEIVD